MVSKVVHILNKSGKLGYDYRLTQQSCMKLGIANNNDPYKYTISDHGYDLHWQYIFSSGVALTMCQLTRQFIYLCPE